jgi:hypothetical protein
MSRTAGTLEEERTMEADLLSGVGTSNGCAVGSGVHSVVVVGDLARRHCLMGMGGKSQRGGEGNWKVLYSISMFGSWGVTACRGSSRTDLTALNRKEERIHPLCVKLADCFNINQGGAIGPTPRDQCL